MFQVEYLERVFMGIPQKWEFLRNPFTTRFARKLSTGPRAGIVHFGIFVKSQKPQRSHVDFAGNRGKPIK